MSADLVNLASCVVLVSTALWFIAFPMGVMKTIIIHFNRNEV